MIDSRLSREGEVIRRRRECLVCQDRFTTHERIEAQHPSVIKKDGRREDFDKEKIRRGLDKAFEKRPVSVEEKDRLVDLIAQHVRDHGAKEVDSSVIGQKVMDELHHMDEVAYVRFASVYRSFRDVNEFMEELTRLLKEKK